MNQKHLAPLLLTGVMMLTACSHYKGKENKKTEAEATAATVMPVTQEGLTSMTQEWPETSKGVVNAMNAKYGLPAAVSDEMIIWNNTAPFKRTIVYREQINHLFPMQHSDVLEQTVDYRVPLDKISELAKFNGSLIVDRTKGELTARNESEEMNILSLNMADKIVRGEITTEAARREYSKNAESFAAGTSGPLLTSLSFASEGNTTDPDTMMQSQTEDQPRVRKTKEAKKVERVIKEEE